MGLVKLGFAPEAMKMISSLQLANPESSEVAAAMSTLLDDMDVILDTKSHPEKSSNAPPAPASSQSVQSPVLPEREPKRKADDAAVVTNAPQDKRAKLPDPKPDAPHKTL